MGSSHYYWLRRVRLSSLGKQPEPLLVPTVASEKESLPVQLAEIPVSHVSESDEEPVVIIRTKRATIEIGARIPDELAEGKGFLLLYKRIEDGTLSWPCTPEEVETKLDT